MIEKINLNYIPEPTLTFNFGQKKEDPRDGLTLFGAFDGKRIKGPKTIGIIGTSELFNKAKQYLYKLHQPLISSEKARPFFPGLQAAFGISINFDNIVPINIQEEQLKKYTKYSNNHQRIFYWTKLFYDAIDRFLKEEENSVDLWIIVIPEYLYLYGRPLSKIPSSKDNIKTVISPKRLSKPYCPTLFDEINQEEIELREAYKFEANFHNQLKARLLPLRVVTQIIRESKINDSLNPQLDPKIAKLETSKAWNICTTLYYKLGGLPWKLGDIREKVCYLGLVYKKVDDKNESKNACCGAQMFLDSGDGMVFRGNMGPWFNPKTKEFHISKEEARAMIEKSLQAFHKSFKFYPEQVFIHSRTYFNDEEWMGFTEGAKDKCKIIGVRITEKNTIKFFRNGDYCIPRGSMLKMTENSAYLWTKGFIPRLGTQIGLEVPSPLFIQIIRGEENIDVVCKDIMSLTKLNYNSCIYGDGIPVTLKFADTIGEILTAGAHENIEVLTFKHYI